MSEQVTPHMRLVEHKGQKILVADYEDLRGETLIQALEANTTAAIELSGAEQGNLLILSDFSRATVGTDALAAVKKVAATLRPHTRANAVVGITKARRFLVQVVDAISNMNTHAVASVEEGLDWLASKGGS